MPIMLPNDYSSVSHRRIFLSSWIIFFLILVLAVWLRVSIIDDRSITQDESTMLQFVKGLLERGYPFLVRGETEVLMTTYELVPYFIALSVKLFGWSEMSVRLPALIFSCGTLFLIFFAGRTWFNYRVAIWATFLFAVSPWSVFWSQNCFYPSQVQFFTMLSTVLVYRVLKNSEVRPWLYYFTAISLCFTYLSWEASGLLFLVYGLMVLWLRRGHWGFLWTPHVPLSLAIVGIVVIGQLVRRTVLRQSYLVVGSGRADISTPQFGLEQPSFNPYYYLENIFASEQMLILSFFFLCGLFFLRRNWELRFVYGFVIFYVSTYTGLLVVQAIRYLYIVLPLFLISASAATFLFLDWTNRHEKGLISTRVLSFTSMFIILMLQGFSVSTSGLNLAELHPRYRGSSPLELHPEMMGVDYKYAVRALEREFRPGDIIVARGPFLLDLYAGRKGDYGIQQITSSVLVYEPSRGLPQYSDKWIGNPVLRNQAELKDVLLRHDRVWFLAVPFEPTRQILGDEFYKFIRETMELKAEGHHVRLYLWERG